MASGDDRQFWKVVGGEKTGGIIVRSDSTYSSVVLAQRLSTGAVINGLELDESLTRLRYELVAGDGPSEGWVTLKIKDKELLVPFDDDPVEDLRYEPGRKQAETVPVARPVKQAETVPVARPVKEPESSPPARRTPPAEPQGSKKMFAWKNPNRDRNIPSTVTAPEPIPSPAPKPTPSVPAEKPSAYPEYPKLDKSHAIEKIGRPKPTPPPAIISEPQIVKNSDGLPTSSLVLPGNMKIEDVVDQMYQLRPGKTSAWQLAKTEPKKGNHAGVPLPRCLLPCTAPDSAVPPGKRLVTIDFVSCSS